MFSYNKTPFTGNNANAYKYNWLCPGFDIKYLDNRYLEYALVNFAFSPIVWKSNERLADNFSFSILCALDFDKNVSLGQAIHLFSRYKFIIAASRNHQKNKHGLICDRFRVILEFEREITDREEFESNMSYYTRKFKSDTAAKDAGRFYYPCTRILARNEGSYLPVMPIPQAKLRAIELKRHKQNLKFNKSDARRTPTKFMKEFEIRGAYEDGSKHADLLKMSRDMTRVGFDLGEIISYCSVRTSADIKDVTRICTDSYNYIKKSLK